MLPKAGVEDAPNTGVEEAEGDAWVAPNTPVAVPPNNELPVWATNVELPKGFTPNIDDVF